MLVLRVVMLGTYLAWDSASFRLAISTGSETLKKLECARFSPNPLLGVWTLLVGKTEAHLEKAVGTTVKPSETTQMTRKPLASKALSARWSWVSLHEARRQVQISFTSMPYASQRWPSLHLCQVCSIPEEHCYGFLFCVSVPCQDLYI